jgi:hypothetical protein
MAFACVQACQKSWVESITSKGTWGHVYSCRYRHETKAGICSHVYGECIGMIR